MSRLVIVSNRVSLPTQRAAQAGGLAVALRGALTQQGGLWLGWSDRLLETQEQKEPEVRVKGNVEYCLIDLNRNDYQEYYVNYSNGALWPLFHYRMGLMDYQREGFAGYLRVNKLFAETLAPRLHADDLVWVQDYHLIPMAAELRKLGVFNKIGFFLHTPFPPGDVMAGLPDHEVLLQGLVAYDLVGFQTNHDLRNFIKYAEDYGNATTTEDGTVTAFDARCRAEAFPISIDPDAWSKLARAGRNSVETKRLQESLAGRKLVIGVDRLDYSKGLPQRIDGYRLLLKRFEQHRREVTFLQIAVPSRSEVSKYRALRRQTEELSGAVNGQFGEFDWVPLRYLNRSFPQSTLAAFYRLARVGLVTPLRDGMNLVAKEYVASQDPKDPGVLILSKLAGAATELDAALLVNPFDRDAIAEALDQALQMSLDERLDRWNQLMGVLRRNTLNRWRDTFTRRLAAQETPIRDVLATM